MPRRGNKICYTPVEIVSQADINVRAQVAVVTKAKLDEISVRGDCICEDKPKVVAPQPLVELVILVDGSDSYNNKTGGSTGTVQQSGFAKTMKLVEKLINGVKATDRAVVTIVQFSGFKQLEKDYQPGSGGKVNGMNMWKVEVSPTIVQGNTNSIVRNFGSIDTIDGNGQLFLALQDLSMDQFLRNLDSAQNLKNLQKRERALVFFTDEEWDGAEGELKDGFGHGMATREGIAKRVHQAYGQVFPCIVRPNRFSPLNEDFVRNSLANGQSRNVHHLFTDDFENTGNSAVNNILSNLRI